MTKPTPSPVLRARKHVTRHRSRKREDGLKRTEFWVPENLNREEHRILQEWMPEIIQDLRKQTEEETGK